MSEKSSKPVVFLAFANDRDDAVGYLRNLPDEARRLRDVLQPAEQAGLCEVVVRSNTTAADIFKVFQDPRYRNRVAILHYGGHANGYQLLLESASGDSVAADAGGLARFLGEQLGLQHVFLNGCSTQQQTQALLDANVQSVISTSRAIDDQVATGFSVQFYQGLAGGASIRTAYDEAAAATQAATGGDLRALYFSGEHDVTGRPEVDRLPWNLYLRDGSEKAGQWNLPEAVNDPLFGLPTLPEQDLPSKPYRHLNWFTKKDAEVFFGRGHQIRELYNRLTAPRTSPIILFYGQSGVGKSSMLAAGLIPRLERDYDVCYLRRGESGLLESLRLAFLPDPPGTPIELAWRAKEELSGRPIIVFLDQVEELYTRPIGDLPDELDQLLTKLQRIFVQPEKRPRGKLVLGFRKEWLAELESRMSEYQLPRTKVFLEPLDRKGIVEVVEGPTLSGRLRDQYGLIVEKDLAGIIADDLLEDRESAIAPTLQILLTKMWTKATDANYEHPGFSQDLYQNLRRDGILLRDFLNQQMDAFRQRFPEAVDSGLLLDILALHTTPLGTADQQAVEELQQQYAHLVNSLQDLFQHCQDLFLLTVTTNTQPDGKRSTRLAHDTLAPLVREQFDASDKPGQRARRVLDARFPDWKSGMSGKPLDPVDLQTVEDGAMGTRVWNEDESRLVASSRAARDARQRNQRLARLFAVGALATIVVIGAIAAMMWQASGKNNQLRILGERQRLMQQVETEMQNGVVERDQSENWLKAAHHFARAGEITSTKMANTDLGEARDAEVSRNARFALLATLRNTRLDQMFDLQLPDIDKPETELLPTRTMFDDAQENLLVWAAKESVSLPPGYLQIWNLQNGEPRIPRMTIPFMLTAGINPEGTLFFTIDRHEHLRLYSVPDSFGKPVERYSIKGSVRSAQFGRTQNGCRLVVLEETQIRSLAINVDQWDRDPSETNLPESTWSFPEGAQVDDFGIHQGIVHAGGSISDSGNIRMPSVFLNVFSDSYIPGNAIAPNFIPIPSPPQTKTFGQEMGEIEFVNRGSAVTVSSYESTNAASFDFETSSESRLYPERGQKFRHLKRNDRRIIWNENGSTRDLPVDNILSADFTADGRFLVTISQQGAVVWDAVTFQPLTPPLIHQHIVSDVNILANPDRVVSSAEDGTVRIWQFSPQTRTSAAQESNVTAVPFGPNVLDRAAVVSLIPALMNSSVSGGTMDQSGRRLVTWGPDGGARVWNLETAEPESQVMNHRFDIQMRQFARGLNGALFIDDGAKVVTWTGLITFRRGDPAYLNPGFVQIWDSSSGLPLSPRLRHDLPVSQLRFDEDRREIVTSNPGKQKLETRQLIPDGTSLSGINLIEYAEIATGTRVNKAGEFHFLSPAEWSDVKVRGNGG